MRVRLLESELFDHRGAILIDVAGIALGHGLFPDAEVFLQRCEDVLGWRKGTLDVGKCLLELALVLESQPWEILTRLQSAADASQRENRS